MHTGRILPLIIILIFCCKSRLKSPCTKHCGQFFGKFGPLPRLFDAPAAGKKAFRIIVDAASLFAYALCILFCFKSAHSSASTGSESVSQSMLPPFERSLPSKSSSFSASKREKPATIAAEATSSEPQYPAFHHDPKAPRLQDEPAEQNILRSDHGGL